MTAKNTNYSPNTLIYKKREGGELTKEELNFLVDGITNNTIPDYQLSALLMAIYFKGMTTEETAYLTDAMLYSGTTFPFFGKNSVDKHSTGGVGDKTSFVLGPIAAACGVKVPMIAGRGLGHTGGTVDKIEAVKGFKTEISIDEFCKQMEDLGIVLIGQTGEIAPADKKLYALRDVTSTVESIPLITASIMSKKLAEGTQGLVMDVKAGSGAFMKTVEDAKALAKSLEQTALRFNKNIMTMITDMSQPLGHSIGNSLEIIECVDTLRNEGPEDLTEICLQLAGGMVYLARLSESHEEGIEKARAVLENGKAYEKFLELIKYQGGDVSSIEDTSKLEVASEVISIKSKSSGYISTINGHSLGFLCGEMGGGRQKADDVLDYAVGIKIKMKVGMKIQEGEELASLYIHKHQLEMESNWSDKVYNSICITDTPPDYISPLIHITSTSFGAEK